MKHLRTTIKLKLSVLLFVGLSLFLCWEENQSTVVNMELRNIYWIERPKNIDELPGMAFLVRLSCKQKSLIMDTRRAASTFSITYEDGLLSKSGLFMGSCISDEVKNKSNKFYIGENGYMDYLYYLRNVKPQNTGVLNISVFGSKIELKLETLIETTEYSVVNSSNSVLQKMMEGC